MQEVDESGLGVSLAATDATPFSRFIALSQDYGEPVRAYPIKIVVAVASPANLKDYPGGLVDIDSDLEFASLQSTLDGLAVELIRIPQPCTLEAIDAALSNGAHVLHLIAHGALSRQGRAVILLANRNNQVHHVYADEHASLLALHARDTASRPDALRLVFLASCQSATADPTDAFRSFAPRLVQAGVPAVLAMQDLVPVDTARAFTQAFYRQLLRHGEVDLASNQARAALLAGQWPAAHVPVLFMRLTDGQLLASNPARTALENTLADPRFAFFDPAKGRYVPLPVEAVHITGHQDVSLFQASGGESTASIDIWDAVEEVLDRHTPHDEHARRPTGADPAGRLWQQPRHTAQADRVEHRQDVAGWRRRGLCAARLRRSGGDVQHRAGRQRSDREAGGREPGAGLAGRGSHGHRSDGGARAGAAAGVQHR